MVDNEELIRWACFSCVPRQGESWDDWLERARLDFEETFPPDDQYAEKGHGGYGLKPKTVLLH